MINVKADPTRPLFDDRSIEPYGVKLMGNFLFERKVGDPGAGIGTGYVSPGHNSAYYDPVTGKQFLIFHTRFPGQGEMHQIRVHQMFMNQDGWPVVAPYRYAGETVDKLKRADVIGEYKFINHGKAISAAINTSQYIRLQQDGTIAGAANGTWERARQSSITWVSSNPAVISNAGIVTRPAAGAGNATVTLTATITKGTATATKTFSVTVKEKTAGGLVAQYAFDGNLEDNTGQAGAGSITGDRIDNTGGTISYAPGMHGNAAVFDGSSGVRLPNGLIAGTTYSVALWAKPEQLTMFILLDQQAFPEVAATSLPNIGKGGRLVPFTRVNPMAITVIG